MAHLSATTSNAVQKRGVRQTAKKPILSGRLGVDPILDTQPKVLHCSRVVLCEDDARQLKKDNGGPDASKYLLILSPEACGYYARSELEPSHVSNAAAIIVGDASMWDNPSSIGEVFGKLVGKDVPVIVSNTHQRSIAQNIHVQITRAAGQNLCAVPAHTDSFPAKLNVVVNGAQAEVRLG